VGAALLGQRLGAEVTVQTPGGVQSLTILDVVPPDVEEFSR
jgi:transcription elongation GreA/GreB family factor